MPIWKLYPQIKNNVEEVQVWVREDSEVERQESYSFASFECESDARPEIDLVNEEGIDPTSDTDYNWDLIDLQKRDGGPWISWSFSDNMSDGEKDEIIYMIDHGSYIPMEVAGWKRKSIAYWLRGPLVLEEIVK